MSFTLTNLDRREIFTSPPDPVASAYLRNKATQSAATFRLRNLEIVNLNHCRPVNQELSSHGASKWAPTAAENLAICQV
jgi:hypothetical protein